MRASVLRTTVRYVFRAGHPAWRRCSSLKYTEYSRSSRLARRAPRSGSRVPIRRAQDTGVALVLALGLAAAAPATAQEPPPLTVEFDEAVRRALERNPTVAQAATAIGRAEQLLQQARAVTLPAITAGFTNVTIEKARGFNGAVTQPQNQFAFSATASVPVLAASRWAAVTQARDQIQVASRSVDEVRQQVAVGAGQAYLAVIAARRLVDVSERSLANARAHLDYAQKRLEGGVGSRLNQLRAAQLVATEDARLENTRLGLRRAQEALGVLLAEPGPVDAGREPAFDTPAGIDESVWRAARPDLQTQTAIQRAAERVVADSWRDWVPSATASFDPQYITPSGLFQPSRTWRLAVTLSQPVFEGGQRRATRRLRELTLDQSRLAMTGLEIQARSEVRIAQEAVRSLDRALTSARLAAEQANEVVRITTTAFEVGATTNLEVIDAQRSARDAESAAVQAEDAVRRARLDLLVALGLFPR
jgi:outer membrane protein TolC